MSTKEEYHEYACAGYGMIIHWDCIPFLEENGKKKGGNI